MVSKQKMETVTKKYINRIECMLRQTQNERTNDKLKVPSMRDNGLVVLIHVAWSSLPFGPDGST